MSQLWTSRLQDEIAFWRGVIREVGDGGPAHPDYTPPWLSASMVEGFVGERERGESIRILDVGSGPFSTVGIPRPGQAIEIVRTDALGDVYNDLLGEAGLTRWPKIETVKGEELVKRFGENVFHLVHCANALDHFEAPADAFAQMIGASRRGGVVRLVSVENEGEREGYTGLHMWNIFADDDGLYLSHKDGKTANLIAGRDDIASYKWEYLDHRQIDFNIIGVTIRKRERH
jgi:hypothetical protein